MVAEIYLNKPVGLFFFFKKRLGQLILFCHQRFSPSPTVRNSLLWTRLCVPLPQAGTARGSVCACVRTWRTHRTRQNSNKNVPICSFWRYNRGLLKPKTEPIQSRPGRRHPRLSCRVADLLNRDWAGALVCTAIPFRADRFVLLTVASPLLVQYSVTVSPRHWKLPSGSSRIWSCNHQSNISSSEASLSSCPEVRLCLQVITSPGHGEAEGLEAGTH